MDVPRPEPGPEEVLVRVHATALNRADLFQREGKYPPPKGESPYMGLEMAGVVERGGRSLSAGDRVFGLLPGGGYAQHVTLPETMVMPIPPAMSFEEAAAIPEVFLTAHQALHWLGRLSSDETVLIHAGASGVGTAAIQLAKMTGARVLVTASEGKHDVCLNLGADIAIDYRLEDFADRVHDETDGLGVNVIVDFIGGPYLNQNVRSIAIDGRIVVLATMGGGRVDEFDLRGLFRRRGSIITSLLRNRSLDYKERLTADFVSKMLPSFTDGTLRPVIDRVMDWTDVQNAHRIMGANQNAGKIVLRVG